METAEWYRIEAEQAVADWESDLTQRFMGNLGYHSGGGNLETNLFKVFL
jgi:hypothetical protein